MRDLKFRAWDKKNNRWYHTELEFYGFTLLGECMLVCPPRLEDIENIVIQQFTGLKDKHGRDVYEGDVCRFYPFDEDYLFFHGLAFIDNLRVGGTWEIIRCDNVHPESPEYKGEEILDSSSFWNDDFEIIGHIHDGTDYNS